ncbi:hypothetical protein CEXT_399181 [Caerostris extrusa]|uniref:C-type lectin domain-containing protein n=1 Tax=Caerostris extrusa TaxID=172846 RepID=A0AAV4TMX7_CAEEX|nr:hypothetical protein CEXT_399181 [Caerostris extrusa]
MNCPSSLWILVLLKVIESCPSDYFKASEDTCLHLAQPTSRISKEEYCNQKGGELFGRPLTPDMKDPLANAIARGSSNGFLTEHDDTWVLSMKRTIHFSKVSTRCGNPFYQRKGLWNTCESRNLYYSNYDGRCLAVLKDYKSYKKGLTSCPEGHLMKVKKESDLEEVVQAFFNGRFFGGVYIGLEKKNGKWQYING